MSWQCRFMQRLISRKLTGELSPRQAVRLDTHLAGCRECARRVAMWSHLDDQLRGLGKAHPPSGMAERISARTQAAIAQAASAQSVTNWLRSPLAAGALLSMAVAAVAFITLGRAHPQAPIAAETMIEPVSAVAMFRWQQDSSIIIPLVPQIDPAVTPAEPAPAAEPAVELGGGE